MAAIADRPLLTIFLLWTAGSFLRQAASPRLSRVIRKWDIFHLIPAWKFFVGSNSRIEYSLLYRDSPSGDEDFGEWLMALPEYRKGVFSFLWNPGRRLHKSLLKDVRSFLNASAGNPNTAEGRAAQLALRGYASRQPFLPRPGTRQIAISASTGSKDKRGEIIYCSAPYPADCGAESKL